MFHLSRMLRMGIQPQPPPHFPLSLLLTSQVEQEAHSSVFLMTALDSEIYEMLTKEGQAKALFISAGDLLERSP